VVDWVASCDLEDSTAKEVSVYVCAISFPLHDRNFTDMLDTVNFRRLRPTKTHGVY
jgi:hypothetical protein